MRSAAATSSIVVLMAFAWTCAELEPERSGSRATQDAGESGLPAPKDTVFAMGIWNNSGGAPQSAALIALNFEGDQYDSEAVVSHRKTGFSIDGDDTEWSALQGSPIALSPRGAVIGLSEEEWIREYTLSSGTAPMWDFGIYEATVKSAFDDENIYFLVQWKDSTEDKTGQNWSFDGTKWTRSRSSEDKLSLAFNLDNTFRAFNELGCGGACHIKTRMGDVSDAGRAYRFRMHTLKAGELVDAWTWKASTTNPMGVADDTYWDEGSRKDDGPGGWTISNTVTIDGGAQPAYMSELGVNSNDPIIFSADAGYPKAVPFDGTDAVAGTTLPGYVMQWAGPERQGVRAAGKWVDGMWTVELARKRISEDPKDVRFTTP